MHTKTTTEKTFPEGAATSLLRKPPFYMKASLTLVGLYVFISMLYYLQGILIPLTFATIVAVSLSPAVNFLLNRGFNRILAIGLVLIAAFLVVGSIIAFLASQAGLLAEAWPEMTSKFQDLLDKGVAWASEAFNTSPKKINGWIDDLKNDMLNYTGVAIGMTLSTVGEAVALIFLAPVYIFMILYYRPHLVQFIHRLFGVDNNGPVTEVLNETKGIIQSYLIGLFAEFAIVACMNSIGLFIIGIDYAILLGTAGALLNVIPYLGGLIAVGVFMIIALITKSPADALYVFAMYSFIQFVDNNFIVPKIVGSRVKLNALICLIVVLAGGALWGIPGMFLSIPLMAVVKVILDRIEGLKAWGFLLGDMSTKIIRLDLDFSDFSKRLPHIMPPFRKLPDAPASQEKQGEPEQ